MQPYDIFMLLVLAAATVFGFWKGMAWQLASLAALVASYFVSLKFAERLAPVFGQQAPWNKFVAMFAIYVGTSLVIWMLFRLVSDAIDKVKLESFDRQMGGIFGLAKGVLLCIGITFFAVTIFPAQAEMIVGSESGHYIVALLDKANSVFPPEIHQVVDPYMVKIEQKLNPNWPNQAPGATPTGWPQSPAPQNQPQQQQQGWPTMPQRPAWPSAGVQPQPNGWPTQPQQQTENDDRYQGQPREPNPYPGPYSAEVQTSREY
jgi:membrane protein required for colicin V production